MKYANLDRFKAICDRHGIPAGVSTLVFEELLTRHSEPHRAYHTLSHLERMLKFFTEYEIPDDEVEFAIWFHDVIYDPREKHNERKSADFFLSKFDGYLWNEFSREVERLIIATDPTIKNMGTNRENLIIDIDLCILGAPPEEYLEYAKNVRKEYDFVPDDEFCKGRIEVLTLLQEGGIFSSEHFKHFEQQASENIAAEIERLQKGLL